MEYSLYCSRELKLPFFVEGVGGKNILTLGDLAPQPEDELGKKGLVKCYFLLLDKWGNESAAAFKCVHERDFSLSFDEDEWDEMSKHIKLLWFQILH